MSALPPKFFQILHQRSRALNRSLLLTAWVAAAAVAALLLLGLAFWDHAFPLLESYAALLAAGALVVFLGVGILFVRALRRKLPVDTGSLVRLTENKHPELLDSVQTAVELIERGNPQQSRLAPLVIADAEQKLSRIPYEQELRNWRLSRWTHLSLALAALGLGLGLFQFPFMEKASLAIASTFGWAPPGITVQPADLRVAAGSDLRILATASRWDQNLSIVIRGENGPERYPMSVARGGGSAFTFFAVREPVEFQVQSSALQSDWLTVEVYQPPKLKRAKINVFPPVYSGREPQTFDQLSDFSALIGSQLIVDLESDATRVSLEMPPHEWPAERFRDGEFQLAVKLEQGGDYRLRLEGEVPKPSFTDKHRITLIPDSDPIAEIWEPGEDVFAEPLSTVPLLVYLADDINLGQAHLFMSISGERQITRRIPLPNEETGDFLTEAEIPTEINLEKLGVNDGDVITYYVVVSDTREPEPNASRSEVFFIEVRIEEPPIQMTGQLPPEEGLDFRGFNIELKRIIRLTYEAAERTGRPRVERIQELSGALPTLRSELEEIRQPMEQNLVDTPLQPLLDLLEEGLIDLEQAELLVNNDNPAEALFFEEMAFSKFLTIENALRANFVPEDGQGEGSQSESEQPPPDLTKETEGGKPQDPLRQLEQLKNDLEDLLGLQSELNTEYDEFEAGNLDPERLADALEQQQEVAEWTGRVASQLGRFKDAADAVGQIRSARRSMREAADELSEGEPGEALGSGERARQALLRSLAFLDDLTQEAMRESMGSLSQAAEDLAERQREAAGESEQAQSGGGDGAAMAQRQQELAQQLEELLQEMEEMAAALGETDPDTARNMGQAARGGRQGGAPSEMARAGNALLYERFQRAQQSQEKAAEALDELSQSIEDVAAGLPAFTPSELERMLEALASDQRKLDGMDPENDPSDQEALEDIRQGWAGRMEVLGQRTEDQRLSEIAGALGQIGGSGPSEDLEQTSRALADAAKVLSEYWLRVLGERTVELNRQDAPPPDRYRKQVEEYFRNLAQSP